MAEIQGPRLFLCRGRRYGLLDLSRTGEVDLAKGLKTLPLPSAGFSPYLSGLKFRQGAFFRKSGRTLLRQDPETGLWVRHFKSARAFSQFEILPDGKIALICPNERPSGDWPPSAQCLEMLGSGANDRIPLMEIFHPGNPAKAERRIPYPPGFSRSLATVNNYPLIDRTAMLGDKLLLTSSQAGQVFQFDTATGTLPAVAVPWPRLDDDFIARLNRSRRKPGKPFGEVLVSQFSFPLRIHWYPQNAREVLVATVMNSVPEPGHSLQRDAEAMRSGNRFASLTHEFTPEERKRREWLTFYRYDLGTRTFTPLKDPRLDHLRLDLNDHWLTLSGKAIPLAFLGLDADTQAW